LTGSVRLPQSGGKQNKINGAI